MEFRIKKQYEPKQDNKEKLKVFLKKIENGKLNQLGKNIR